MAPQELTRGDSIHAIADPSRKGSDIDNLRQPLLWWRRSPLSSADVKYTIERSMNPSKGMASPRGPVCAVISERVGTLDSDTVIVHGKGPSGLLLPHSLTSLSLEMLCET